MTPTRRLALLLAVLFAVPEARADWTGTFKLHIEPARDRMGTQEGTIAAHGTTMRVDSEQAQMGKVSMIVDFKSRQGTMIMEQRHAFMTMDLEKMQARSPLAGIHCDSGEPSDCLPKAGFAKTGSEVVNGKKSDRWEVDRTDAQGQKRHETLWVPQGVKGFAMVREEVKSPERTMTLDVLDFKETSVPASQFAVPDGYTDMTNMAHGAAGGMRPGGQ